MKIVDVSEFYSETGGGVRSYVLQKLDYAARHGHSVTIVAPGAETRDESRPGGKIAWVRAPAVPLDPNYRMFWRAAEVHRVIDAEAPDVIEGSSPWRGGWIAGQWPGRAVKSFFFHQDFVAGYPCTLLSPPLSPDAVDRLFGWFWAYLRRLSQRFDVTVAGGDWLAARLGRFSLRHPVAVPLGVEPDRFSPAHRDPALRRDLLAACGMPESANLLLAVARMHPEKRLGMLIDAFAQARVHAPAGLVIVGDGLMRRSVEKRARATGNVHLAGAVRDRALLARYFASADLLVHGSGAETYGLVVAEAMSSGLPAVVPDRGGAADFAGRGDAVTYPLGDAAACAQAIRTMLARGAARSAVPAPRISSTDAHFAQLFDLYGQMVQARRRGDG